MLTAVQEIKFWSEIMKNHCDFIITSLAYTEEKNIEKALRYKYRFTEIEEQSEKLLDEDDSEAVDALIYNCMTVLLNFINFKKQLLKASLECSLDSSLPPTFYNHMINEAMEFYRTLNLIRMDVPANPILMNIKLHKIWLPDAAGHAATIACDLDPAEKLLIKKAKGFQKTFDNLTIKADELEKMVMRVCFYFGALSRLNDEAKETIAEFICYLDKVKELKEQCKIMGTFKPLVPDHMIREEKYYIAKIKALKRISESRIIE